MTAFELSRRSFLAATVGGVGVSLPTARSTETTTEATYVLEQGDRCIPVVALSGDESVESFYDYRTPFSAPSAPTYSSYGTTHLQRPETSVLFLYEGPDGLSLVVLHDKLNDGTNGGAASFEFGNLTGGAWVVGDDIYDAPTNYDSFEQTDDGWHVDWTWTNGRSDGGVYGSLSDDFEVTVAPQFNEEAELYGDPYEGEITDWQVLTGDRNDPDRISLDMDEPITIRAGQCGSGDDGDDSENDEKASGPVEATVGIVQGRVNPESNGRLQLALYSTEEFAAGTLDASTARFGPDEARVEHVEETDVDGDDLADLLLHFRIPETGVDWDTEQMTFTAKTDEGREVSGTADVRLVPQGGRGGGDKSDEDGGESDEDGDEKESGDDSEEKAHRDEGREEEQKEDTNRDGEKECDDEAASTDSGQ